MKNVLLPCRRCCRRRQVFRVWLLCPNRLSMWMLMIRKMETLLRFRTVILSRHGLLSDPMMNGSDFLVWLRPCCAPLVALFACYLFPFQFPLCMIKIHYKFGNIQFYYEFYSKNKKLYQKIQNYTPTKCLATEK